MQLSFLTLRSPSAQCHFFSADISSLCTWEEFSFFVLKYLQKKRKRIDCPVKTWSNVTPLVLKRVLWPRKNLWRHPEIAKNKNKKIVKYKNLLTNPHLTREKTKHIYWITSVSSILLYLCYLFPVISCLVETYRQIPFSLPLILH